MTIPEPPVTPETFDADPVFGLGRLRAVVEEARRARALSGEAWLSWIGGVSESASVLERTLGLWVWSEVLTGTAFREPLLSDVARWIRGGRAPDVRSAALVLTWRARPELAPVVAPLVDRLAPSEAQDVRLWATHALYALAEARVPMREALPGLFALIAEDDTTFSVASFAVGVARRNGESFAAVADDVARTLAIRWESADAYTDLLDGGFVPPAHHLPRLVDVLAHGDDKRRTAGLRGVTALIAAGEKVDAVVAETVKHIGTTKVADVERALATSAALVVCGVPAAAFFAAWESALAHKTVAGRKGAQRALATAATALSPADREAARAAAEAAGFAGVAQAFVAQVIAERPPGSAQLPTSGAPPLDVAALAQALRGDTLADLRRALFVLPRAVPAELVELVPALVDVLATEERHTALEQLSRAVTAGLDVRSIVPVVAGLLLDRDFHDRTSLAAILQFLAAALDRGYDIALAWPWIPTYLDGEGCEQLRIDLAEKGMRAGLDGRSLDRWLPRNFVDASPVGHPSGVLANSRIMGAAAEAVTVRLEQPVEPQADDHRGTELSS